MHISKAVHELTHSFTSKSEGFLQDLDESGFQLAAQ